MKRLRVGIAIAFLVVASVAAAANFTLMTTYGFGVGDVIQITLANGKKVNYDLTKMLTTAPSVYDLVTYYPSTAKQAIFVEQFNTDNVGGAGHFRWKTSCVNTTANGGTLIDPDSVGGWDGTLANLSATYYGASGQGTDQGVDGNGCWERIGSTGYVEEFGAVANGSTNVTVPIQAKIDSRVGIGGKILFDRGTYIHSGLTVNSSFTYLEGVGKLATVLMGDNTTGIDVLFANSTPSNSLQSAGISQLTLNHTGTDKTAGSHLYAAFVYDMIIEQIDVRNSYNGITLSGVKSSHVNEVSMFNGGRSTKGGNAFQAVYDANGGTIAALYIDELDIESRNVTGFVAFENGIYLNSSDGIWIDNSHVYLCNYDMLVTPTTSTGNFFTGLWVNNTYFDASYIDGVKFAGNSENYGDINFVQTEHRAAGLAGMEFANTAPINGVTLLNANFRKNGTYGVLSASTGSVNDFKIIGSTFNRNGQRPATNISNIYLNNGSGFVVSGNTHISDTGVIQATSVWTDNSVGTLTDGFYRLSATGGTGTSSVFDISVTGGVPTVTKYFGGEDYTVSDAISISVVSMGATGTLDATVSTIFTSERAVTFGPTATDITSVGNEYGASNAAIIVNDVSGNDAIKRIETPTGLIYNEDGVTTYSSSFVDMTKAANRTMTTTDVITITGAGTYTGAQLAAAIDGVVYEPITTATKTLEVNKRYVITYGSNSATTLPSTFASGDWVEVVERASDTIQLGVGTSSMTIESTVISTTTPQDISGIIKCVGVTANTTWVCSD